MLTVHVLRALHTCTQAWHKDSKPVVASKKKPSKTQPDKGAKAQTMDSWQSNYIEALPDRWAFFLG